MLIQYPRKLVKPHFQIKKFFTSVFFIFASKLSKSRNNTEKGVFYQHLQCRAPRCWLQQTTIIKMFYKLRFNLKKFPKIPLVLLKSQCLQRACMQLCKLFCCLIPACIQLIFGTVKQVCTLDSMCFFYSQIVLK